MRHEKAVATSPAKMKATGRVNRPRVISKPPISSISPWTPGSDVERPSDQGFGSMRKSKIFAVPCSRKKSDHDPRDAQKRGPPSRTLPITIFRAPLLSGTALPPSILT